MVPEVVPLIESPSPARDGPPVGPGGAGGVAPCSAAAAAMIHPHGTAPQAEVAGPAKAGKQVPFRGSLEGVVTMTPLSPTVGVRASWKARGTRPTWVGSRSPSRMS